ncbi:MAG: ATP-binding protein [Candidatus Nitrosopelagicus sp.]|nr:ATP-binding protein [Candidatus Nitrosopelagicus sp.]
MSEILPIWDPNACVLRDEILSGSLSESELALNLSAVIKGIAKAPYDNPKSFFEATYQTQSMKEIISDVSGRLSGSKPNVNPIILLDVGFGGGKTHTLVTLYYAAKHESITEVNSFLEGNVAPSNTRVVALSGDEYGGEGIKRDNIQIKTIWGDMFFQLGKYDQFKKLDQEYLLPSLQDLRDAFDGSPVLILLDELPSYMKVVQDKEYLLDKSIQFIQRLVIAISEKEDAILTVAVAENTYKLEATKTKEAIVSAQKQAMAEATAHIKRKEKPYVPIKIEDVVHILNRRLFKSVNPDTAKNTAKEYLDLYSNLPVSDKMKRNSYLEKIQTSYPFHPELIDIFYQRLATLDRFQNTRGALRILANVVKRIWDVKENDATLIHPFHIDLADDSIANDLTHGIGESRLKNAVEGDIWNSEGTARAQESDEQSQSHWDAPLVRRVCNTVFLYSLVAGKDNSKGIEPSEISSLSVTPVKDDHFTSIRDIVCEKILMDQPFQFIDRQGSRFVFVKEAPPIKVIDNIAKNDVMIEESTRYIEKNITNLFGREGPDWLHIEVFRPSPQDFIDEPSIRVAILNPNSFSLPSTREVSKDIENFLKFKDNNAKKLREFTNSAFLLVATKDRLNALHITAKKIVAADRVRNDLTQHGIQEDRKKDVESYLARQMENINDSIRAAFTNLIFYDREGIKVHAVTSSGYSKASNGADMLALQLKSMNRVNDQVLDPSFYVMEYVWPKSSSSITVKNLFDMFHQVPGIDIPSTKELFTDMIKRGIETNEWVLKENEKICTHKNIPHHIPIDNSSELILLKEAEKRGLFDEPSQVKCDTCGSDEHTTSQHNPGKTAPPPPVVNTTSNAWTDASLNSLTDDLDTFMKRDHFDKVTWIKLEMSEKQIYLASIKNFLTKMEPEQNIQIHLDVRLLRPSHPNFELSFVINKDEINTEEGKSILDLSWKVRGVENVEISLDLTWNDGVSRDEAIKIIKSLGDGSVEPINARMHAKMSRGSN